MVPNINRAYLACQDSSAHDSKVFIDVRRFPSGFSFTATQPSTCPCCEGVLSANVRSGEVQALTDVVNAVGFLLHLNLTISDAEVEFDNQHMLIYDARTVSNAWEDTTSPNWWLKSTPGLQSQALSEGHAFWFDRALEDAMDVFNDE